MQTNQITIFDTLEQVMNLSSVPSMKADSSIADVRSDKQKGNNISYDIGEKIGGARKDLDSYRADFLAKPSINLLQEIEKMDIRAAAEILNKKAFFTWFSLEDCKERGVKPGIARSIQLFINRIPKESDDSQEARERYTRTLMILSTGLQGVHTQEEYYAFEKYIWALYGAEHQAKHITCVGNLKYQERGYWMLKDLADGLAIKEKSFKGSFWNYFHKPTSRAAALNRVFFEEDWDNVLPPTTLKKEIIKKPRKVAWVRELPENPLRDAGSDLSITAPETFMKHFGFRAVEFGNWVEDKSASFHLRNAAEAYLDLAELLTLPIKSVSLGGTLAMAFGSRGSGSALGHYESSKQVINLTKVNGSLGILAHEWFHALDSYLFNASHDFENGKIGFLSNGTNGESIASVQLAMNQLVKIMKEGTSTSYIDVKHAKGYRFYQPFVELYNAVKGNLQSFMDVEIRDFDRKVERQLSYCSNENYRLEQEKKYARKRVNFIRTQAEALSDYHFKKTGERVDLIPYTSNHTQYYLNSIKMDKKGKKYWSSDVELVARAFESYIAKELKQLKWRSDYLVCGAYGSVYPEGEELERIHAAMSTFLNVVRPVLSKGSSF